MQEIFIVTGEKAAGKTTFTDRLLKILMQENEIRVCGFLSRGYWHNNHRSHYTLENIQTGRSLPLCGSDPFSGSIIGGPWYFFPETISGAEKNIITQQSKCHLTVIDEAGKLELQNLIWHNLINKITQEQQSHLLLVVRKKFVEDIITKYQMNKVSVIDITSADVNQASRLITNSID